MSPRIPVVASLLLILALPAAADAARLRSSRIPDARERAHAVRASATPRSGGRSAGTLSVPDGAGGLYYVTTDYRDGSADVYLFRIASNAASPTNSGKIAPGWPAQGAIVCRAPGTQFPLSVIPDSAGGAIVLWYDDRDDYQHFDIYAQRLNPSGVPFWTADGVKVVEGDSLVGAVAAAPDGSGGLLVAWPQGLFDSNILATRITSAGALAAGWDAGGEVVCGHPAQQDMPAIAEDGFGGAYVAWVDYRDPTNVPQTFGQRISAAGTAQWAGQGIRVDLGPGGTYATAIVPKSGHAMVFWSIGDSILGQRLDDAGAKLWGDGVVLSGSVTSASSELIAISDGYYGAIVAWSGFPGGTQGYQAQAVNGDGEMDWDPAGETVVAIPDAIPGDLDICPDGSGGAFFAWIDHRSGVYEVYVQHISVFGAGGGGNGAPVIDPSGQQLEPAVAPDGAGGVLVSFLLGRGIEEAVYSQHIHPSGVRMLGANGVQTWANPGTQNAPLILHTTDGGVLAAWAEKRSGTWDIRARKFDENGVATSPGHLVASTVGDEIPTALVDDGAGGAIVAFLVASGFERDIYAQRINGSAVPQWTANGVPVCVIPGEVDLPLAVSDGAGGIIMTWADFRDVEDVDLYAQRVSSSGIVQWTENGVPVCATPGGLEPGHITSDSAGGAIIAWSDHRTPEAKIFAQRLNADGERLWGADGVPIASYDSPFSFASVYGACPAGDNGAIVLIQETTFNLMSQENLSLLHVQRIDGTSAPQWGSAGMTIGNVAGQIPTGRIVEDGAGGALIAWNDDRNQTLDIFGQHVDAAGLPDWTSNGKVICDAASYQDIGSITHAGDNLIVTWTDFRSGNADVYAQRVNAAGVDQWVPNGMTVAIATRGQFGAGVSPHRGLAPESFIVGWCDNRLGDDRQARIQRLNENGAGLWTDDGVTDVVASLVSANAEPGRVRTVWLAPAGASVVVYRRADGDAVWASMGRVTADGSGRAEYDDRDVVAGARYGYRIGIPNQGDEVFSAEAWVDVPVAVLALDRVAVGASSRSTVTFMLPHAGSASLELIDISGRRIGGREFEGLGAGAHTAEIEGPRASGVYFVRLRQGVATVTRRVALVR